MGIRFDMNLEFDLLGISNTYGAEEAKHTLVLRSATDDPSVGCDRRLN